MSIPLHIVYGCFQATMAELIICDRNHSANKVCNIYYPFFFFFFGCTMRHADLSSPGTEPRPLAVEALILNHWLTREVPSHLFFNRGIC